MSNKICIMCNQDINDPYRLGEKITFKDVTVHYFCLVKVSFIGSGFV